MGELDRLRDGGVIAAVFDGANGLPGDGHGFGKVILLDASQFSQFFHAVIRKGHLDMESLLSKYSTEKWKCQVNFP